MMPHLITLSNRKCLQSEADMYFQRITELRQDYNLTQQ